MNTIQLNLFFIFSILLKVCVFFQPEENTENVVEATEELQSVSGSFLSLNITKGFRQLDNVYGKLFSKRD